MSWLMVLAVVAAVLILAVAARFVFHESRRAQVLDRRLTGLRAWMVSVYGEPEQRRKRNAAGSSVYQFSVVVLNILAMLVPIGVAERAKLRQLVIKAGFRHPDALSVFMTIKLIVTLAGGVLAGLLVSRGQWLGDYIWLSVLAGLVGAVIGGLVPEIGLRYFATRRLRKMTTALPDALDLMMLGLESGLTFERTLVRVVQELRPLEPELARELALVEVELRLGGDRKIVFGDLYTRTEIQGVRDMATTLVQGERYGTPLAQSMQNIARNERVQRAARIAAQVERLPVLMTLPALLLVTPGTILLVAGPAFLLALQAMRGLTGQ